MSTPAATSALPDGQRYVRYGVHRHAKYHLLAAEPRPRADGFTRKEDYVALCGRTAAGASVVVADAAVLADVGWLNAEHVCNRCIAELGAASDPHATSGP